MKQNKYRHMFAKTGDKETFNKNNLAIYTFEPKFSGIRVFIYKEGNDIEVLDPLNRNITHKFPELLDIPLNVKCNSCILDAELVLFDKENKESEELLELRNLLKTKEEIDKFCLQFSATVCVFDILELDGLELINKPLRERKKILDEIIVNSEIIKNITHDFDGKEMSEKPPYATNGIIAKDVNSRYEQTRSWQWLKLNDFKTREAIALGYKKVIENDEKILQVVLGLFDKKFNRWNKTVVIEIKDRARIFSFLDLIKEIKQEKSIFDEEELEKIPDCKKFKWLLPNLVLEFFYDDFIENNFVNPNFFRIRFDKDLQSFLEN